MCQAGWRAHQQSPETGCFLPQYRTIGAHRISGQKTAMGVGKLDWAGWRRTGGDGLHGTRAGRGRNGLGGQRQSGEHRGLSLPGIAHQRANHVRHRPESLFAFHGKKIVNLWEHDTEVYGFQLCSDSIIENYDIAASTELHAITVTGIRKRQYGKIVKGKCRSDMAATKITKLPARYYCWDGKRYAKSRSSCPRPARKGR